MGIAPPTVERWQPIAGLGDGAEVSNLGEVRDRSVIPPGKVTQRENPGGYRYVIVDGRPRTVHQLVLEAFVGPKPFPEAVSRHLDGDQTHNWTTNLKWGTQIENADDKRRHGTHENTRRTTCRRRSHALVEPNLEPYGLAHSCRRCLSCHWGYTIMVVRRKDTGRQYDRDVLADQMYAYVMGDGPDPRNNPALRRLALAREPEAQDGSVGDTPSVTWALRRAYAPGEPFSARDARQRVSADLGKATSGNSVYVALARDCQRGEFEKLTRGHYRRLARSTR